ncbi:5-methyltetrahydropteroyltriglutamate--homocysteine methyltransferase-like isoform X4 [Montipora foliosa]|uniref:5-methyltetrahydropteroyltriglutamate-- homocysteine methyltransferase-like isoform X4 n=1 Tax=Montipora foliosa TaxID=591990 RepID=UPI0035F14683
MPIYPVNAVPRRCRANTVMPLSTTVIGSFPKPSFLNIPDWFDPTCTRDFSEKYTHFIETSVARKTEELIKKAVKETAQLQADAGLDVISDGEFRRENHMYYFCRKLTGFDFHNLCSKNIRREAATILAPRIVAEISTSGNESWVWKEWKNSQDLFKELPMKITLPGPMTITDSVVDQYYGDQKVLGEVLSKLINVEIKALVSAGCNYIQDQVGYKKASKDGYFMLADRLDQAGFDQISIEDAHRHNDLSLFQHFKKSKIVLGSVKIACSRVESVEEIRNRLQEVLTVVPPDRLIVAPDCGLGFLPREIAKKKLCNMVQAAKSLP